MTQTQNADEHTPNLKLSYIIPGQSQKHVMVNENFRRLDDIVQLSVNSASLNAPPADPDEGAKYIIANAASGDWTGYETFIAAFVDGAWIFYQPLEGWMAWVADTGTFFAFDGTSWESVGTFLGNIDANIIGINADADTSNRLAVSSDASLFSHDGDDHRLKINRNAATDTASILFQTGYAGSAEIGLAGTENLDIKTSADGTAWQTNISIDPDTGYIGLGTSSPTGCLDISPATALSNIMSARAFQGPSQYLVAENGYDNVYLQIKDATAATNVQIHSYGKSFFNGGNVGIGTQNPTSKLHVNDAIRIGNYTPASLPSASSRGAGALAVTIDSQGDVALAISDGTNWHSIASA